jgi:hypothetical protein
MAEKPAIACLRLIVGAASCDARGKVIHVNAFDFEHVDRCYIVRPSLTGDVRGWVGHRRD